MFEVLYEFQKANAKMFNLGLIETDIQMPDAAKILECIEGTQLAQVLLWLLKH